MRQFGVVLAIAALATVAACRKTKPAATNAPAAPEASTTEVATGRPAEEIRNGLPDPKETVSLATIYFDTDSYLLTDDAKAGLRGNSSVLIDNPDVTVRVEGHADERGETDYNLALGERRAMAVRSFLVSMGIPASRLEVVSFGEEKPAVPGHDEETWAKNRRVELEVTAGAGKVSSSSARSVAR